MFRSDTHLPHVLPPATYHDESQFATETARLLWPAWHCVASTANFRRDATYDAEEGAWYLALGPRQAWTDFCLFDPANPCIFVAAEKPVR